MSNLKNKPVFFSSWTSEWWSQEKGTRLVWRALNLYPSTTVTISIETFNKKIPHPWGGKNGLDSSWQGSAARMHRHNRPLRISASLLRLLQTKLCDCVAKRCDAAKLSSALCLRLVLWRAIMEWLQHNCGRAPSAANSLETWDTCIICLCLHDNSGKVATMIDDMYLLFPFRNVKS